MKYKHIILILIILVALVLRLWQIGHVPASLDWDEAALGYNAYSLLHTGRDEFGVFLPTVLQSFGDYKPALYAYIAIPFVAIFSLTTFAVRFPSVIMGVLGIWVLYLLVKELLENRGTTEKSIRNFAEILALVSAFLLAISPWQIQFSRTAFETNTGLTFNLLVGLFFVKGLKKPWMLLFAVFFAALNLSVYQSERVFTPLLVFALVIIYRKELFALSKKYLIGSVIVGLLTVLPMLIFIVQHPASLERVQGTSLFFQQTPQIQNSITRSAADINNHDVLGRVIDNKRVVYLKEIASSYLVHFDPNWLFIEGDNARHHAPGMGLLYLLDLPFLLIGIYVFLFGKFDKKTKYIVFSWLLLSPVPAAVTFEVPHAVRAMNMLPMLLIFIAVGYVTVFQFMQKYQDIHIRYKVFALSFYIIFFVAAAFNFNYYLNQYFVQLNYFNASDWQYGYSQAIQQIENMKGQYNTIVISNKTPMDESYIFFLYYLHYPPQQYQQLVAQGKNFTDIKEFDKYQFRPIDWNTDKLKGDTLYVGSENDFPTTIKAKDTIDYPDGKPAILLVDPKNNL